MRFYGQTDQGEPIAFWPAIHKQCAKYERFVIEVKKYDEVREVTDQQFAYLHAVVFPLLANTWDCSKADAEFQCKERWGEQWMIKRRAGYRFVLSKTVLTANECNDWIDNIWEGAASDKDNPVIIPPPDKDWRETERKVKEARR